MKHFGLIGHPLGHSFSQAYFTEKFESEGLDCEYENYDIEDISLIRQLASDHDLKGFNVTIPYKEAILPYLDELDPVAAEVGAVNTVKVLPNGRLIGYNTDVIGLEESIGAMLYREGCSAKNMALVLGTGGASKAVQYVLCKNGIPYHVVSRDPEKGDYTYSMTGTSTSSNSGAAPAALPDGILNPDVVRTHPIIINATPVGMAPNSDAAPAIPYEAITSSHLLFDLIYNPQETLFLRHGREHGAQTINGLAMLHAQAEASWRIWTDLEQSSPK